MNMDMNMIRDKITAIVEVYHNYSNQSELGWKASSSE